ncbi:hypothetical protein V5799_021289 [Amblyomma americanum]|uniref:Uncharacterized protein n=1 Tax=Amblyomma americanum TaxID=6943 RepID=A0AAQ4FQE5_AMBAM
MKATTAHSTMRNYLTAVAFEQRIEPAPSSSSDVSSLCKAHECVTDAEILWTLKMVASHYSYNSSAHTGELFKKMFPDSEIAKSFSCGERKSAYVVCHGLRPFFLSCLQRELEQSDGYTVLFDESLNDCLQKKQMDIHLRYWSTMPERVTTRYYTSVFMGHSTAEDLKQKLLAALADLPLAKAVQLSMDGPNVNLKCFREMQKYLQQNHQVQCLDLGTCGLHTIHNAYRAGAVASKWGIENLLSSLSAIFHDAPARREDFTTVTGQMSFPLNFVAHRWVENVVVIERAIALWGDVKRYVECAKKKEVNLPKCASFTQLCEFCQDPLLLAKLNFALGIAMVLKPFLTEYQMDKPLMFFLKRDVECLVRKLLARFMKCSVLSASTGIVSLLKMDLVNPNNHVSSENVDIGHAAEEMVKAAKVSAKDVFAFRMECKQFLISTTKKILQKSPLTYHLVRSLSSLDPRQMTSKPDECLGGLRKVLDALIAVRRLGEHERDSVLGEYTELLQEKKHNLRQFDKHSFSLDEFYLELLKVDYKHLWKVVRLLLVLSHGQATVERGFSVNRQVSVENLKEISYVSQRIVYDAVSKAGGILNIVITKELRRSVLAAHNRYRTYLEGKKKEAIEQSKASKRGHIEEEIHGMKMKRRRLEATIADLTASADNYAERAEATSDITFIVKSNSLRKTAKEKTLELAEIDDKLKGKLQELNHESTV